MPEEEEDLMKTENFKSDFPDQISPLGFVSVAFWFKQFH